MISIQADEAQLVAAPRFLIVSDESKPQATASVRADLQALAGQRTPTDDDAAMRRPVLQTAKSLGWIDRCWHGKQQWRHPEMNHQ